MLFRMRRDIDVFVFYFTRGDFNLDISSCLIVHSFRNFHYKLFDERGNIPVSYNFSFIFFDAKNLFRHLNYHILLHFHLTTQTPAFCNFFSREVWSFSRKDLTPTFKYLTLTLNTSSTSSTG